MSLSNIEIINLSKIYNLPLQNVVMKDELKGVIPKRGLYIVNMESSTDGNGTHWVAVIFYETKAFYFDSFSAEPPLEVVAFIHRKVQKYAFNCKQIQDLSSDFCGWFCIALAIYVKYHKGVDFYDACNDYADLFNVNTQKNDSQLVGFFKEYTTSNNITKRLLKY